MSERETGPERVRAASAHYRSRRKRAPRFPFFIIGIIALLIVVILAAEAIGKVRGRKDDDETTAVAAAGSDPEETTEETEPETTTESPDEAMERILKEAELKKAQYDYDAAIELINENEELSESEEGQALIAECEEIKGTLVRQDITQITHVFFHTLIMDNSKAFDGDDREEGYNQVMTTKSEFLKMMESMHEKGFVLVQLHDIAYEKEDPSTGAKKMVAGDIMLPPGKKAFVLSQDDVCYYEYMDGDGFAKRFIIDEDGRIRNEMIMDDGSISVGAYDCVPLLDDFVEEHPDFSYRGAKGCVAVTGYNGVFGYRTDVSYEGTNPNIEEDRKMVGKIADVLRASGWEIASHSWGHRAYGKISMSDLRTDNQKWLDRVGSLFGGTDILIFAFGNDIADWHPYKSDNERFNYLYGTGFRYFCNVDSNQYFVQLGDKFLRQGRRNLDGFRMWQDMTVKNRTSDLFDAKEVFDPDRPTPVPSY